MNEIEDLYPLSPMQQGMLFHSTHAPETGVYVEQTSCAFRGDLDVDAFAGAWQRVMDRHAVLRSAFVTDGDSDPVQVVFRRLALPLEKLDWRGVAAAEQNARFEALLESDRRRGFDVTKAPLLRLTLVRTSDEVHRFVWTHHHILLDGWSIPRLFGEVLAAYGNGAGLPPVRPYRDYIAWLEDQDASAAEAFWRRTLAGLGGPTRLPVERSSPGSPGYSVREARLTEETTARLEILARQFQVTPSTVVQGAWAILLSRYSRERDVVFGATVSGRPADLPGAESMIGLFINTLPVRVAANPDEPLESWLRRMHTAQAEMRQYEFSRLVDIQTWSGMPRGLPLFENIVVFENYPVDEAVRRQLSALTVEDVRHSSRTNYPLTVVVSPARQLGIEIAFDTARFGEAVINRMLGHMMGLLEGMAVNPEARLRELPMLQDSERQRLAGWSRGKCEFFPDRTVHQVFEAWVERQPEAEAVVSGAERLTYAELNRRADLVASELRSAGVAPEAIVAICLERSPEMIAAALGVMKAGAAFLPIDPSYPRDRIEYMLDDAKPALVIGAESATPALTHDPRPLNPSPRHLAYVIYTSGSTGRPKGTLLEHRGFVNFAEAFAGTLQLAPGARMLQFASPGFDAAVCEMFAALLAGAVVHIGPRDAAELPAFLRANRITAATLPPSLLQMLPAGDLPELRSVMSVGEACAPEVVEKWAPGRRFFNGYGPTETTVGACWQRLEPGMPVRIGRPIPNAELYVVGEDLELAPAGVPGELVIGGVCVGRGYLRRSELTAERFIPDPFSGKPGGRLYRTGDLVRWSEEGALEYLGRIDEQVKLRGYRIEPGEIESVLREYAGVGEAVVVAPEERLVAYVVGETGGLREYLKRRLPDYMLPGAIVKLEALPRLPNGKVDRRGLPRPEESAMSVGAFARPRTPAEEMLCEIWRQVLKRERVGIHDNFFDLGGHSLLATQLLGRLQEPFGVEVPLRALFEHPTIAGLAEVIEGRRGGVAGPPIGRVERGGALALSFAQQRLWFLEQLAPGSGLYNNPMAVRLRGKLDVGRLEGALNELIARHEALRTRFVSVEGKPGQVIEPEVRIRLVVEEAGDIREQAEAEARQPFDLERGPLVRARLLRVGEEEHVGLVTLHHIISDGWSTRVLVRELSALYAGEQLGPLGVQYADYASWQRGWLQGEVLEEQLNYWREQLQGAPRVLELSTDRPRPAAPSFRGGHYRFGVGAETAGALKELSRREGVTLFMVLVAAYAIVLSRWAGGQEDVVMGTPVANRKRAEVEGLIGFFVNTLVLRTKLVGDPTVRELLGQVREVCLGAYGRQDVPFEMVVEEVGVERDLSHAPLFQVMLVWNNAPVEALEVPGLRVEGLETESGTARFDLTLEMGEAGEKGLWGSVEYARDLWEEATVGRLAGGLVRVLEQMEGEKRVSELELVSGEEARQVLVEWNATECEYPRGTTVGALFEAEARAHPERVAVRFEGREVTYGELDRLAEERAGEIERGQLVGIERERSVEQVVEQLAVWKAGGAYVPIDPGYPEARRRYMREDSGAGREKVEGLAYVIYTSGSTGRPKGVEVGHEGLCNLVKWQRRAFGIGEGSRVLQFAPSSFDASVWETWMALGNGGTLVLGRQEELASMEGLHGVLKRERITVVTLPPTVLGLLEAEGLEELGVVIAAGEVCGGELVKKWGRGRRFFNAYGPTETTVCATAHECAVGEGAPPIGRPIANMKVYVLDRHGKAVPVGVRGEIWVGGVGLARGYRKRAELTAERFVETRWGRLYRTGDVGRWRGDGELEYLGRVDGQVKLRGYRIELGEVEAALRGCGGVKEAAAAVKGERLVGYVVGGSGDLRKQLRAELPEYMVPQAVVRLEGLPVLPNGKVDRKALPEPEGVRPEVGPGYVGPRTEVEERVAEMCGELLGVERVGVEDSFWELGGHSLLATQLVSRIREAFGVELALRAVFEAPTVAGLAARIAGAQKSGAPRITAVSRDSRRVKRSSLGGAP